MHRRHVATSFSIQDGPPLIRGTTSSVVAATSRVAIGLPHQMLGRVRVRRAHAPPVANGYGMPDGRFAPSPTGELHLGNLRTALVAWLFARSSGGRFVVRMEDLDRVTSSRRHEVRQLVDLAAIGLDWDDEVVRQSERFDRYDEAIAQLAAAGLTYHCYCSRREIREAVSAPHGAAREGAYPGTCRDLTAHGRQEREAAGRPPATRLRADGQVVAFTDRIVGPVQGIVEDIVLRRNDGVPAYHLAVVVDDAGQGIGEVVRGDDLLPSTPSQINLGRLLGLRRPAYAHVPLVLGPDGSRLAKRHGAVTLAALAASGLTPIDVFSRLAMSLELTEPGESVTATDLIDRFDPASLARTPWVLQTSQSDLGSGKRDREG